MSDSRSLRSGLPRVRRWALACIALVVCAQGWPSARAEEATPLERRVKAAYLYKFAGFVEWPEPSSPRAESPFTIAIAGDDQMVAELVQLTAGRTLEGRSIAVKRMREGDSLAGVQILFVGRAEGARMSQWLKLAQSRPILTVTEAESALPTGSVINFVLTEGRVRFEIALEAADRNKLVLSSRLLAVAQTVRPRVP